MPKCPVCRNEYIIGEEYCSNCGFTELDVSFVSEADAQDWERRVVSPCRAVWNNACSAPVKNASMLERELEQYIKFGEMIRKLDEAPLDHSTRSTLIDALHQIFVFRYNYPVDERQSLLREILFHIAQIDNLAAASDDNRLKFLALAHTEMKAEQYLSLGQFAMAMASYTQYLSSGVFERDISEFRDDEDPVLVHDDVFYLVLHNCRMICKYAGLIAMSEKFDDLCKKVNAIQYDFTDHSSDKLYFCGMLRNIQSPYHGEELNEHLRAGGHVQEGCTYANCLGESSFNDVFFSPLSTTPWVGQENEISDYGAYIRIDGVSELISKEKILKEKQQIWSFGNRILNLFER